MKRIVLIIEYDGTNYVGWQIQPNGIAVQQVIGNALKSITGENLTLHASGRTDSGVHARAQAAHFDTESRIPAEKFAFALNTYLPPDIRIKASLEMPREGEAEFHARFSVQKKHYRYRVLNSRHASAFCAARRCIFIPRSALKSSMPRLNFFSAHMILRLSKPREAKPKRLSARFFSPAGAATGTVSFTMLRAAVFFITWFASWSAPCSASGRAMTTSPNSVTRSNARAAKMPATPLPRTG